MFKVQCSAFFVAYGVTFFLLLICSCAGEGRVLKSNEVKGLEGRMSRESLLDKVHEERKVDGKNRLVAGASRVDITPYDKQVYIAGFMQNRKSRGVKDPVFARVLFLDNGVTPLILVSLDLVGYFYNDVLDIRGRASPEYGDNIMICSTHNHAGPDTLGYWGWGLLIPLSSGIDREYMERLKASVVDAINEAVSSAKEARLKLGSITIPPGISQNLRFPGDQTKKDNEMSVMHVEDLSGSPIATMVNYACHAEAMFEKFRKISADFPGYLYTHLESLMGGITIFFNGALGGMIVPDMEKKTPIEERTVFAEKMGRILAEKAAEAIRADDALLVGPDNVPISIKKKALKISVKNWRFNLVARLGITEREFHDKDNPELDTEVNLIEIGPARMVTIPGELFPSLGFEIKEELGGKYGFILGLGNDEIAYIMKEDEFDDKRYSYERSMSMGRETGAIIMNALREMIKENPEN